jgi:peptidoglycan hydrolase-like protein with peptidoglycan-binding domain
MGLFIGEKTMETAKQWTRRVVVLTALLAASGTMLLWSQADHRETKADVKTVQENLRDKGYYNGQIDGIAGPQTKAGIRQYQKAENLPVTGRLDDQTAGKLGVGPESVGGSFKGAGQEVGEGGKQAGHEVMKGKPIAAGKEMGKGVGRGGKKAGHGIKEAVNPESDRGDREKKQQPESPQ